MKVTLSDIAAHLGISASTVSRALSVPERVNPATRQRVLQAAQELGYLSPAWQAAPDAEPRPLGLVVPDIVNPFFPPIIKAVQARAAVRGRSVILADIDEHPPDELIRAEQIADQVDGLIVVSARTPREKMDALINLKPIVLVNRSHERASSVDIENDSGIFEAVEHLVALGHRKISYLAGPRRSWSNTQRLQAMRSAAEHHGVELVEFGPFEPQIQAGIRAADLIYASGVTAVIAYDDLIALGVITRLNERGIQVGHEVSVIGIDDSPLSGMTYPTLTSIHVPGAEAGMTAVDVLVDLLDATPGTPEAAIKRIRLETRLVVRGSTGSAPA